MRQKLKKAGERIVNLFVFLLGAATTLLIILKIAGILPFVVMSGSMEPEISTGSLCFVNTNVSYERIEKGDIIAFSTGGDIYVTHRVISVETDGFLTKGDGNDKVDLWIVKEDNYKGKTVAWIPYIGYILHMIPAFLDNLM